MPEKALDKLNRQILPQWKICFLAALVTGFVAHFYKITNWLPNWDSLVFRYDAQNMIGLGRWFLPVVCAVSSFYDLPFFGGVLAIVFHALGAVCICRMLDVRRGITAFLVGAVVISFPTVTSVLMYNYVADGYAVSFFLACMAAFLMTSEKPRYVWAGCFVTLSVAIYQAYITVTVMLVLLKLTDELTFSKKGAREIFADALRSLACGAAGMVLYYIILNILLSLTGAQLLEYQGMNSALGGASFDLPGSLYVMKGTFVNYFFDFSKGISAFVLINILIAALTVFAYVRYAVKSRAFASPLKVVLLAAVAVGCVVGPAVLALISADIDYHNLMCMGYCVFYIFFIILYERGEERSPKYASVKCWSVLCVTALLIFCHIVTANVSWHKAQIAYEKSYGTLIRIADRIEQCEDAHNCREILVVGALEDSSAYGSVLPPDITGITDGYILRADDETVGQSVLCSALNDYCSMDYSFVSGKRKNELMKTDAVKAMAAWPAAGCVNTVDGVVVVKLGEVSG